MDSSAALSHHPKLVPKQCDTFFPATGKYPSSRRTPSFSSSSSSLSPYNSSSSLESFYFAADDPLLSPYSPLRFSGVPFSWEHLPGIPKKQTASKKKLQDQSSMKLLPLPPPTSTATVNSSTYKKRSSLQSDFQRDPFFAAMVECSKDDDLEEEEVTSRSSAFWNNIAAAGRGSNSKVSRSLSDRFGFINLYSCKRASSVSESIIYLPSSSRSRGSYQHFSRRSL